MHDVKKLPIDLLSGFLGAKVINNQLQKPKLMLTDNKHQKNFIQMKKTLICWY
jgi:hypothetical protein